MHLLMTRPRAASERFIAMLSKDVLAEITPILSPLIRIRGLAEQLRLDADGIIFTSANGVQVASGLTDDRTVPCFCVGRATTQAAQQAGWRATFAGETAAALIARLRATKPSTPLLHLRGDHTRGDIAKTLTRSGLATRERVIYAQDQQVLTDEAKRALAGSGPVIAPVFSPRTARILCDQVVGGARLWLAALSPAVAESLKTLPYMALAEAETPDAAALATTVELLVKRIKRVEGDKDAH